MYWLKATKYVAIALAVIAFGGLMYDAISSRISLNNADRLISDLRADNQHIRDGLHDAQERATNLSSIVDGLSAGNRILEDELERSSEIVRSLRADNRRVRDELGLLRGEIERSRETIGQLRDENQRLGDSIGGSVESAESLTRSHRLLGDSIDRALHLVDKYGDSP